MFIWTVFLFPTIPELVQLNVSTKENQEFAFFILQNEGILRQAHSCSPVNGVSLKVCLQWICQTSIWACLHLRHRIKCSISYVSGSSYNYQNINNPPSSKSWNPNPHFDLGVLTSFSKLRKKEQEEKLSEAEWSKTLPWDLGNYARLTAASSVQRWKWHNANFSFPWLPTALTAFSEHSDPRFFSIQHC